MSRTFELAESAVAKFTSSNSIPVIRATLTLEEYKASLVQFYYYWHNHSGTNTSMAVDEWLAEMRGDQ